MKKRIFLLLMFFLISLNGAMAAEMTPSFAFKYHLHNLFESYSNLRKSANLKQYDEMNKHLKNMAKSVGEIRNSIPKKNTDGTKFDRKMFIVSIDKLNNTIQDLMVASSKGELNETKLFRKDMLNVCVGCHTEVRLKYLFDLTGTRTLFAEYMHDLADHIDIAKINVESGNNPEKVVENIRLINFYLGLLEDDNFPEKGPSGLILDKNAFNQRLKETKAIGEEMLKKGDDIKMAAFNDFKKSLNVVCVTCHEPERMK